MDEPADFFSALGRISFRGAISSDNAAHRKPKGVMTGAEIKRYADKKECQKDPASPDWVPNGKPTWKPAHKRHDKH